MPPEDEGQERNDQRWNESLQRLADRLVGQGLTRGQAEQAVRLIREGKVDLGLNVPSDLDRIVNSPEQTRALWDSLQREMPDMGRPSVPELDEEQRPPWDRSRGQLAPETQEPGPWTRSEPGEFPSGDTEPFDVGAMIGAQIERFMDRRLGRDEIPGQPSDPTKIAIPWLEDQVIDRDTWLRMTLLGSSYVDAFNAAATDFGNANMYEIDPASGEFVLDDDGNPVLNEQGQFYQNLYQQQLGRPIGYRSEQQFVEDWAEQNLSGQEREQFIADYYNGVPLELSEESREGGMFTRARNMAIEGTRLAERAFNVDRVTDMYRAGRFYARKSYDAINFMTEAEATEWLYGLEEDELIQFQQNMWASGMYGTSTPIWGMVDDITQSAFNQTMNGMHAMQGDMTMEEFLARGQRDFQRQLTGSVQARAEDIERVVGISVTGPETLNKAIDVMATELLGGLDGVSDDVRQSIVAQVQASEREAALASSSAYQTYMAEQAQFNQAQDEVDIFIDTITGGNQGIFNGDFGEWQEWATAAGYDPGAFGDPTTMRGVLRHHIMQLYEGFGGNWWDVATYLGASGAANQLNGFSQEGSIMERTEGVIATYNTNLQTRGIDDDGEGSYNVSVSTGYQEDPSVLIENALRDANPAVYGAESIAARAREFFGLLGTVV